MRKVFYLLGELTDGDVEWLLEHGRKRRVDPRTVLIHEGRASDTLFIVLQGALEVSSAALGGSAQGAGPAAAVRLSSGEVVGEMSFVDSRPPSATVTAAEPSVVFAIPRDALARHLGEDDGFAARFYRALAMFLSHRLRSTVSRLGHAAGADVADADELDSKVLQGIHLAGARFDRVLQRLLTQ
jgi:CRP-like cAMP-binding protein